MRGGWCGDYGGEGVLDGFVDGNDVCEGSDFIVGEELVEFVEGYGIYGLVGGVCVVVFYGYGS